MKDWETPPKWTDHLLEAIRVLGEKEIRRFVWRTNEEYWPWHVLRHKPLPAGVAPEVCWAVAKMSRIGQMRELPLIDTSGQKFRYWVPPKAQEYLQFIDRFLGGTLIVDDSEIFIANRERFLAWSLIEEAISSSIIEGAATTRPVAREMLIRGRAPRNRSETMIANNYRTIQKIKELAAQPLSVELLLEIHASMTHNTMENPEMCGRFRKPEEQVRLVDRLDGEILHIPPAAVELPKRVETLCALANDKLEGEFMHPVVRAIFLHFWLAYDHPFVDGNGRTARALFYWYLLSKRYWLVEFLSISRVILKAREQYSRAFIWSERDEERDATYFLMFHLRKLCQALEDLQAYLKIKARELREGLLRLKGAEGLNARQRELLQDALKRPQAAYTFLSQCNFHGVAYATARADLLDLCKKGLLRKAKAGHQYVFSPVPDLAQKLRKPQGK